MDTNIALVVYFCIGAFACAFVVISFFVGEVGDFFHDATSPMTDWLGDHLPFAGDHSWEFPRILNTGSMLGFIAGFGFTAALTMAVWQVSAFVAAGWGILGGLVLAGFLGAMYFGLKKSHATTSYNTSELVGKTGQVVERIYQGGAGRVECVVNGTRVWHTARSSTGEDIPVGTPVRVERVVGDELIVSKSQAAGNPKQV